MELLYTYWTVAAVFVNVVTQIITVRYLRKGLLASVCVGFVFGLAGCVVSCVYLALLAEKLLDVAGFSLISVLTYLVISYCYFHFINLGETARRIRLLREISTFETSPTVAQLVKRYGASEIYQRRLERLVGSRQIKLANGRYVIGQSSMSLISRVMSGLRLLVFGGGGQR